MNSKKLSEDGLHSDGSDDSPEEVTWEISRKIAKAGIPKVPSQRKPKKNKIHNHKGEINDIAIDPIENQISDFQLLPNEICSTAEELKKNKKIFFKTEEDSDIEDTPKKRKVSVIRNGVRIVPRQLIEKRSKKVPKGLRSLREKYLNNNLAQVQRKSGAAAMFSGKVLRSGCVPGLSYSR